MALVATGLVITNPVPPAMSLYVGDIGAVGSGPVLFSEGIVPSQLVCTFGGTGDLNDCLEFSNDGGTTFSYRPQADAGGYDASITHIRVRLQGIMAPAVLEPTSFSLRYRMKVK
ncbi:MAG TPA: hypothetical protein VGN36_07660 [Sphingorhabdus sp.]|nr:hypothetical protein [Sphingorhabdus sp.]